MDAALASAGARRVEPRAWRNWRRDGGIGTRGGIRAHGATSDKADALAQETAQSLLVEEPSFTGALHRSAGAGEWFRRVIRVRAICR